MNFLPHELYIKSSILGLMSSLSGILSSSHFLMNIHIPNMPAIYSRTYRKDFYPHWEGGGVQPARVIETQLYKRDVQRALRAYNRTGGFHCAFRI